MGSKFCKKGFCATCVKCKKQKAKEATAEVSETSATAQTSAEALARIVNQFPTMEGSEEDNDETRTMTQTTKEIREAQPAAGALQETEALNTGKSRGENGSIQPTAQVTEEMGAKLIGKETPLCYPVEFQPAAGTVQETGNELPPETTGEAEVSSAGEAEIIKQVTKEAPQGTEACTASETAQDTSEGRWPYAQLMEGASGATVAVELLQKDEVQNAAQAAEEPEAARDSETQPLAEMSEGLTGKTEPQFAAQITEESETWSNTEHVQNTNGTQYSAQTGQLTVRDQFSQVMEETGSQANRQAIQDTILDSVSADTEPVTPENTVQSLLQDTSTVSTVYKEPEKNAVESVSHPSDPTQQEQQPPVQVRQKETWYGTEMTKLENVQCQQSVEHPRVLGALTGDGAEERDSITKEQDQILELETSAVTVHEQKQTMENLCLPEKVPNSIAGTDAPVNPVVGRQEVDSQVLKDSVPEMDKDRGEEETATAETLSALKTQGSEGEVIPDSGSRSGNNEVACASGESQSTDAADSVCVCRSWSPSRIINFICCCSS